MRDEWESEDEYQTEFGEAPPEENVHTVEEGVMQTGIQHDEDIVRLQIQCPEFRWVRDALQPGGRAEGPPPGPLAAWMDRRGKRGQLTMKFTTDGDPVVLEVDSSGKMRTIVPEPARRGLFL